MAFKSGAKWKGNNKGRPKGTGHRQQIFNELVMPHSSELINKAVTMAKEGDEIGRAHV